MRYLLKWLAHTVWSTNRKALFTNCIKYASVFRLPQVVPLTSNRTVEMLLGFAWSDVFTDGKNHILSEDLHL